MKRLLVIDDNGISGTLYIDRASYASIASLKVLTPANLQRCAKPLPLQEDNSVQGNTEYVVGHIVRHIGKKPSITYVVRWYSYGPEHDTGKPEPTYPHILSHAIRGKRPRINLNTASQSQRRNDQKIYFGKKMNIRYKDYTTTRQKSNLHSWRIFSFVINNR